jgi:hypothetical protein
MAKKNEIFQLAMTDFVQRYALRMPKKFYVKSHFVLMYSK